MSNIIAQFTMKDVSKEVFLEYASEMLHMLGKKTSQGEVVGIGFSHMCKPIAGGFQADMEIAVEKKDV